MTKEGKPDSNTIDVCQRAMTDDVAIRQGGEVMKGWNIYLSLHSSTHQSVHQSIIHTGNKNHGRLPSTLSIDV